MVRPFVGPELWRRHPLALDSRFFLGETWRPETGWSDATREYVERIHTVANGEPSLLLAHAYTRYLGDLSGVLAKAIKRHFRLPGPRGVEFYSFPLIPDIAAFKADCRRRLDALALAGETKQGIVEEAQLVFRLNRALADELWAERNRYA